MKLGQLTFSPIADNYQLVATPVADCVKDTGLQDDVFVAEIDPELADTAAFCDKYGVSLGISTNCLVVEARRGDKTWYAACLILATDMADINGAVRRHLEARKISFAAMDKALAQTNMEYGGITPIGLPADWPILIDEAVMKNEVVVIGGGVRGSKIAVTTKALASLPNVTILGIQKN